MPRLSKKARLEWSFFMARTGGGNITGFAGNAAASVNSLSALSSANARNTRASEKLY